jgi:hypothetical protein
LFYTSNEVAKILSSDDSKTDQNINQNNDCKNELECSNDGSNDAQISSSTSSQINQNVNQDNKNMDFFQFLELIPVPKITTILLILLQTKDKYLLAMVQRFLKMLDKVLDVILALSVQIQHQIKAQLVVAIIQKSTKMLINKISVLLIQIILLILPTVMI